MRGDRGGIFLPQVLFCRTLCSAKIAKMQFRRLHCTTYAALVEIDIDKSYTIQDMCGQHLYARMECNSVYLQYGTVVMSIWCAYLGASHLGRENAQQS